MSNIRYPLEFFLRVITVSLETMKIVHALPNLVLLDRVKHVTAKDAQGTVA